MDNFLSWAQLFWLLSNNWLLVEKLAEARIVQWYPCPGYLKLFPLAEAAAELAEEVGHVCGQTSVISTSAVWKGVAAFLCECQTGSGLKANQEGSWFTLWVQGQRPLPGSLAPLNSKRAQGTSQVPAEKLRQECWGQRTQPLPQDCSRVCTMTLNLLLMSCLLSET